MKRFVLSMFLLGMVLWPQLGTGAAVAQRQTEGLILVTLDGVRIQEVFGGMDPLIVNGGEESTGIYDLERALNRFWKPGSGLYRRRRDRILGGLQVSGLEPRGGILHQWRL